MKVSELNQNRPPKILIYGGVGTGKTALALTLGAKAQIIDMDDGLKTGTALQDSFSQARGQVDVRQFLETNPQVKVTSFAAVKKFIYGLPADIQAKRWPYQALILDSLSAFADSALAYIMGNGGRLGDPPEIQHWGLAFNEIQNVMSVIRTLPCVVVLIAHDQIKTSGKGLNKEESTEIAISGKNLPSRITRYFDEVWYMRARTIQAGKRQYVVQTIGDESVSARSRSCLPNLTDTSCGMWELIKKIGYVPPTEEVNSPKT